MKFNGPDIDAIRAGYSLRADMPKQLRALCDEVERLRGALELVASHGKNNSVVAEYAAQIIFPAVVSESVGCRS